MQHYTRILVVSVLEDAVNEFIRAIPSANPLSVNISSDKVNLTSHVTNYYRKVIDQDDLILDIFGFAGDVKRFDFILEILVESMPGILVLVDQQHPETVDNSKALLALIRSVPDTVHLEVEVSPDGHTTLARTALDLSESETLVACDTKNINQIKQTLLTLFRLIPTFVENNILMTSISQLE